MRSLHYFSEREALENDRRDGKSRPQQLHFCAGHLHGSECCFADPCRLCDFPDQTVQPMGVFSRHSCSRCLLVHWPHRCWPTSVGSPNPLQMDSSTRVNHDYSVTIIRAAEGGWGDVDCVQSRCSVLTGKSKCFIFAVEFLESWK